MLMQSWPAYENYTGPLGLQTLTDITGSHYGPNVEASERNGWGQWHKADHDGVGFDRTVATGTGYVGQYPPEVAKIYESTATTPDNLLLFFHHVPYTYKLHDGKTVVQYLYDSHYDGAAQAAQFVRDWTSIKGKTDPSLYNEVLPRLEYQAGHAIVWRDAITQYFLRLSGIPDAQGRAGQYPNRLEAEDARLTGYKVIDVNPWEDASRGKAVSCESHQPCTAELDLQRQSREVQHRRSVLRPTRWGRQIHADHQRQTSSCRCNLVCRRQAAHAATARRQLHAPHRRQHRSKTRRYHPNRRRARRIGSSRARLHRDVAIDSMNLVSRP